MNLPLPNYLQPLEKLQGPYPEAVIAQAIARKDETLPHLIRSLEFTLENAETLSKDDSFMLPVYTVALLGFFEAEAALPVLIALTRHPLLEDLLGDGVSELLPQALASCAKSNPSTLLPIIEDQSLDEYARSGALQALGILHAHDHYSREDLDAYLLSLYNGRIPPQPDFHWEQIFQLSLDFDFRDHIPLIEKIYDQCDDLFTIYSREEIRSFVKMGLPVEERSSYNFLLHPDFELGDWHCFTLEAQIEDLDDDFDDFDDFDFLLEDEDNAEPQITTPCLQFPQQPSVPYQRPAPKVGRNEPCPCGSGKKYKKCCGA